jgi:AcrR family transcriptional regulator
MAAARRRRTYESPLRAEQVDRTREKLIEAGVDVVAEGDGEEVTVRRVAARAKVSVPTAYRYFPDRDALLEAIAVHISERVMGVTSQITELEIPGWTRGIYVGFEANDKFMRAQLSTAAGRSIRARSRKSRDQIVMDAVARTFPSGSATMRRRMTALMRTLVNVHTWLLLHDDFGMSGTEAGELVTWAMAALIGEARRRPTSLEFDGTASPEKPRGR